MSSTSQPTAVTDQLHVILGNAYLLKIKTQSAHWNVTGSHFVALHQLFEEQYNELNTFIDEVAERIRALGPMVDARLSQYQKLSSIDEQFADLSWKTMVSALHQDQLTMSEQAKQLLQLAQQADDGVSEDMAIGIMTRHQKAAWMLASLID